MAGLLQWLLASVLATLFLLSTSGEAWSSSLRRLPLTTHSLVRGGRSFIKPLSVTGKDAIASATVSGKDAWWRNEAGDDVCTQFESLCHAAQDAICAGLEKIDGSGIKFVTDSWERPETPERKGGAGRTRVLGRGRVFEKAGVNLSIVHGKLPREALREASQVAGADPLTADENSRRFYACGVSSVIHPHHPRHPTMHFNFRFFRMAAGPWWFGGGADITPSYLSHTHSAETPDANVAAFHSAFREVVNKHFGVALPGTSNGVDETVYRFMKKWADDYFLIPHRGERRGAGGFFYDDLNLNTLATRAYERLPPSTLDLLPPSERASAPPLTHPTITAAKSVNPNQSDDLQSALQSRFKRAEDFLPFVHDAFATILPAYAPFFTHPTTDAAVPSKPTPKPIVGAADFGLSAVSPAVEMAPVKPHEKVWQSLRRGRYVEFNLVNDRGTKFGLQSGGRVESILMSLPEASRWRYDEEDLTAAMTPEEVETVDPAHRRAGAAEKAVLEVTRNPIDWE